MITASQMRAARSFLDLDQSVIAEAVGVSKANISEIENEKVVPKASTLSAIQKFFEIRGIEFRNGGILPAHNVVEILEGDDAYLQLLDHVLRNIGSTRELLKFGTDERKSSKEVIEKNKILRASNISMRNLIEPANNYVLGPIEEYRHIPVELYSKGDIKLIYGDCVAYMVTWANITKAIIMRDEGISAEQIRNFNFIWEQSSPIIHTTSKEHY